MEENEKIEEAKEEDTVLEPTEETAPEAKEEIEEPCDPTTMSCDEMRDKVIELADKRSPYIESIKKLEEVRQVVPSDEINKAYDNALSKKKEIDDEIYGIFEKFTVCTTKPVEELKEEENIE